MARERPDVVFLGDSILWGYQLENDATAVAALRRQGCRCENLAFKSGSPPNYYVLARLFETYGVRPKEVVIEVNQRVLNPADPAYKTLHPALAIVGLPYLTDRERDDLGLRASDRTLAQRVDGVLSSLWLVYAARADLRDLISGDADAVASTRTFTEDDFAGTYDARPLDPENIGVAYLLKTVKTLRASGIRVLGLVAATNHDLLHEDIDTREYRANDAYLRAVLRQAGAQVLDLDTAFSSPDFIDNAHLTARGQTDLAVALAPYVGMVYRKP